MVQLFNDIIFTRNSIFWYFCVDSYFAGRRGEMGKFDSPVYDECRKWIQKKNGRGMPWDQIRLAGKADVGALDTFLKARMVEDDWPYMSVDEWAGLVDETKEYESKQQDIRFLGSEGALFDTRQDNGLAIPQNERSCWQQYKNHLGWKKESVDDLENATIGILRRLSTDTRTTGPIKGLVIGHVQSGKTANMEALMAMAADHGWNMFIVLSGTIENLRGQTLRRMQKDLNQDGNVIWHGIEHPSKMSPIGSRTRDLNFRPNAQTRYFTVCLKNSGRLKKLIDWLQADKASHDQMKILVIDDEADQASISNTAVERKSEERERKGINKLIVDLVEDRHYKKGGSVGQLQAMNYVMYTATPYANFLNESTNESLYPKDFIWTLKTSDEYIGPNEIFGLDDPETEGLDIVREITETDLSDILGIYDDSSRKMPQGLRDAILWFICAVSVMRYWGYNKKPISMLVHTSQKQVNHDKIAKIIKEWFITTPTVQIIKECEAEYQKEITRIPKSKWLNQFSHYSEPKAYGIASDLIRDYPAFEVIRQYAEELLSVQLSYIKMTDDQEFVYGKGLHLVIDNCSKNGIHNEDEYIRLAYPDPDVEPYPDPAPAFIIIGGSTLSRGLTIEGLVSTFFLRASCQADSLMQMGRWFGYRRFYELMPRIWMTSATVKKFRFLSQLEVELREDLKKYMISDVRPIDYGPRIKSSPKVSWLRLTSRHHMSNAVPAEMDFTGVRPQTTVFDKNITELEENINITDEFIASIKSVPYKNKNTLVWKNVPLKLITDKYFSKMHFSSRSRTFNEIELFCQWLQKLSDKGELANWSVIVCGAGEVQKAGFYAQKEWTVSGYSVQKVNRSKRKVNNEADTAVDIGVLRSLSDCVADIDENIVSQYSNIVKQEDVDAIRKKAGADKIPLLLIYRIDKDSKAASDSRYREDLNMPCDIIGINVCVPGDQISKRSNCVKVTIDLPPKDKEDEVED